MGLVGRRARAELRLRKSNMFAFVLFSFLLSLSVDALSLRQRSTLRITHTPIFGHLKTDRKLVSKIQQTLGNRLYASTSISGADRGNVSSSTPNTSGFLTGLKSFAKSNWLVIGEVIVITFAKFFPKIGCTGGPLRPEFFISKLGVFTIFFINGIAISFKSDPSELASATKTNLLIQFYNLGFMPIVASLLAPFYPNKSFVDGLLVLSVIPTTINICVAQTLAAGGNMGTVIFNAIMGNLLGVLLTPVLAVLIMNSGKGGVSIFETFFKLGGLVVLPMVLGQLCRRTPLVNIADKFYSASRTLSSLLLLAIVYTTFSDTFLNGLGVGGLDLALLLVSMPIIYVAFSAFFWKLSKKLLPGLDARTRTAALLCSSQKTLAFGIPFIKTALGSRPDLAYLLAPLLLYAPCQLVIGSSIFVPLLRKEISREQDFDSGGGI